MRKAYKRIVVVVVAWPKKQPITRTEDRLFDRGWVRSAMATRKCGNIYFPKYFRLEGSKQFLENFVRCTI